MTDRCTIDWNTSSTSKEPTVAKPDPVIVVTPLISLLIVAVPSVTLPPVITPDAVIVVAPVTAPPSTFTLPSSTTAEPVLELN